MLVGIQDEILRLHSMGLLKQLLVDKTTRTNIIWATDAYQEQGAEYQRDKEIKEPLITGQNSDVIKTRARKAMEQQSDRTRKHAEVFTPLWICQKMVRYADDVWFGKTDTFSDDDGQLADYISSPSKYNWKHYVDARRLEITCGEAPYLVNRYDVSTGESILLENRGGILDRKLRVVNENAYDEAEWLKWAIRAFQSTYGYEFQGDNVLIARVNLLMTFEEYLYARWKRKPSVVEYREIVKIIAWNIWQMDGLSGTIPYCKAEEVFHQINIFEWIESEKYQKKVNQQPHCRIYDWRRGSSLEYTNVNKGGRNMKFDFVIGNPPYQDEMQRTSDKPIYNLFIDAVYPLASVVELITPARFLFDAGKTPKDWNKKMLADEHLQVLFYEQDSSKIFANTDIKGGVAITYHDDKKIFNAIQTFTVYSELNTILKKVLHKGEKSLCDVVFAPESYKFTKQIYSDYPEILSMKMVLKGKEIPLISKGHDYDLTSNIFDKLYNIVFFEYPNEKVDSIRIFGRKNNERKCLYIKSDYIAKHTNLNKYKVFFPKANGAGKFGEIMTGSDIGEIGVGHTQTFISIGAFDTLEEAKHLQKYLLCKFTRSMLYILKVTQDNKKSVWKYVPIQDFTSTSDIDWSKSIADIDRQLYAKYGLDDREVAFIESHVKEMV